MASDTPSTSQHKGLSDCCVTGSLHEGQPTGKVDTVYGLPTYIAPSKDGSKAKTVIIVTDVFGWELINTRLLADIYAESGLHVLVPDFFKGDSLPLDAVEGVEAAKGVLSKIPAVTRMLTIAGPWLYRHREAVSRPLIESYVKAVKADPDVNKVGTTGFCWGGRYSFLLSSNNDYVDVDASVANHPSLLSLPKEAEQVNKPILVQVGDIDNQLSLKGIATIKKAFASKKDATIDVFPNAKHGFAVRCNLENPTEKEQYERATRNAIAFFHRHLA